MKNERFLTIVILFFGVIFCYSQSQDVLHGFRAGRYEGHALNTTANARGKVVLDLYDLDNANGNVRAYCEFSEGLEGEAWLSGRISGQGELELSGKLASFRMEVQGHVSANGSVTANYRLEGDRSQQGNFEVSFLTQFPPFMKVSTASDISNSGAARLLGAWEVGGGLPATVNPVTGRAGVSFVDAHRLEFLPDGHFKHLWSHRHCDGASCCNEQAKLEEGTFSLTGQNLEFDITGGTLIATDPCNPKLSGHTPVKPHTESFSVSTKSDFGQSQLCLQSGGQAATCYQKQT